MGAVGLQELLLFLFSTSGIMLITVTEVFIVDTLRKQHSLTITVPEIPRSDFPHVANRSIVARSQSCEELAVALSSDNTSSSPSLPSASRLPTTKPWEKKDSWMTTAFGTKAFPFPSFKSSHSSASKNENDFPSFGHTEIRSDHMKRSEQTTSSVNGSGRLEASKIVNVYPYLPATVSGLHTGENDIHSLNVSARITPLITRGKTVKDERRKDVHDAKEKKVSWYLMLDHACVLGLWIITGPFWGAWSDRHGRKLLMLLPNVLHVLAALVYLVVSLWPRQLLTAVWLAGLLRGACGQTTMFVTATFSSLSDALPQELRSTRFASLSGWYCLGVCGGNLGAGILLEYFPISCPFLVSSSLHTLCFFIVLVALKDTLAPLSTSALDHRNTGVVSTLRRFLCMLGKPEKSDTTPMTGVDREEEAVMSENLLSERENAEHGSARRVVVILALSFGLQSLWASQRAVMVQIVSLPPFEWPKSWYGYLYAVDYGTGGIAALGLVPLLVRLVPRGSQADIYVLVIALLCGAGGCAWSALAVMLHSDWQVFVSRSLVSVGLSANATYRAMLSKEVTPSAQATAQTVLSVVENVAKILSILLHTTIFVATFSFSPSIVHFLMTGEAFLLVLPVRWLAITGRHDYDAPLQSPSEMK